MKSTIQKMAAKLLRTKHLAIALAATGLVAAFPIFAHALGPFTPKKVYLSNANPELVSTTSIIVATQVVKVGSAFPFSFGEEPSHRLVIDYSSVGAVAPANAANRAVLFLGCFVDGVPCVGSQDNPTSLPGWVNVLSCDYSSCAQWDNSVSHVWYTDSLSKGSHTVVIRAAVGHFLVPSDPFIGNAGILFDEARNLVVTVLEGASEDP